MALSSNAVCAALAVTAAVAVAPAGAAPVTYSMFGYTDISLNGRMFHNAAVTMMFSGDTADIETFCVPAISPCDPTAFTLPPGQTGGAGWQIAKGTARVRIESRGRVYRATFLPNQILVTYDLYNGGAGFSSIVNGNFEPAYPFTADGSSVFDAPDLVTNGNWSGHLWSCVGFPPAVHNTVCGDAAAHPLATDAGPLVVYQRYEEYASPSQTALIDDFEGSLNVAFFSTLVAP